ncbi:energy-coupling factor ABC transporter ATP-binding protein [Natranaerobius thermophilus]|uniref:ABC transporter related n=1 Tax=Natranaerobius thermophilus (strain ATCC BAA-1301 / DSM 18059 / JW/NM-WN-LF) TaxID=457570 RepID=B2A598_NATTJ|nr:ABC transporter ATP-binding protein [Natranaerobius thermophilus]ACB83932.1 ABC transporter related [Natranaerobius thermophilus JW/NM-WN-LF]
MSFPVEINNLGFRFPSNSSDLLQNINLKVKEGEVLAIVGLSGCGKSTLCYCISGIIPLIKQGVMEGEVLINGRSTQELSLSQIATNLGIVFQNPETQLFSPTVEDEIAFGPENLCFARDAIEKRVDESLKKVGMEQQRYKNPHHLSGGQKQLIALASVLSLNPKILIFDEAMSKLDPDGKKMIKDLIIDLKNEGRTIIMVEHDMANLNIADRVKLLDGGKLTDFTGSL